MSSSKSPEACKERAAERIAQAEPLTPDDARNWLEAPWNDLVDGRDADCMATTIAGMTWEYGVEQDNNPSTVRMGDPPRPRSIVWRYGEQEARRIAAHPVMRDRSPRVVRRMVGPVEVVRGD